MRHIGGSPALRVCVINTLHEQYTISELYPSQSHIRGLQRGSKAARGNTCLYLSLCGVVNGCLSL